MKDNIYKELFTLVKKDGERLVVIDPETDEGLVVIRLSEFKRLSNENREIMIDETQDEITADEPILAKNLTQNLSFWDHAKEKKAPEAKELDNKHDSGRIHECKSVTGNKKEELELVPETLEVKEESAGEEYYFEPAEEIGL